MMELSALNYPVWSLLSSETCTPGDLRENVGDL